MKRYENKALERARARVTGPAPVLDERAKWSRAVLEIITRRRQYSGQNVLEAAIEHLRSEANDEAANTVAALLVECRKLTGASR